METIFQVINENWRWLGPVMMLGAAVTLLWMVIDLTVKVFED